MKKSKLLMEAITRQLRARIIVRGKVFEEIIKQWLAKDEKLELAILVRKKMLKIK